MVLHSERGPFPYSSALQCSLEATSVTSFLKRYSVYFVVVSKPSFIKDGPLPSICLLVDTGEVLVKGVE